MSPCRLAEEGRLPAEEDGHDWCPVRQSLEGADRRHCSIRAVRVEEAAARGAFAWPVDAHLEDRGDRPSPGRDRGEDGWAPARRPVRRGRAHRPAAVGPAVTDRYAAAADS